ncbi:MAG: chorismate mutase [Crocinitomicaceae bacterium]|nr:chorismate mutase [Crocinitomicaceae bacterium]
MDLIKEIKKSRPFVIAGPCSAETEEQVHTVLDEIARDGKTALLRAGIRKPRTRPNSFEGLGELALPWLLEAGKKNNLPVTTEVANAKHVEIALKYGVDVLWIGARTTVNPFAIQEIADALKGAKVPVIVKNPVNPDLMLWVGAFERLQQAGITQLAALHRGFSIYKHAKYRNIPNWEIPIALREEMPEIPLLCDPSHISGKREGLLEVAQKAMDLNYDGLMIETHPNPDGAWSDPAQQVTANGLNELLSKIILRKEELSEEELSYIVVMREKIAGLDDRIFSLLSERMKMAEEVGLYKRENDITILQQEHWRNVIANRLEQAENLHLTNQFVRSIMDAIHQESIRHQTKVMNPSLKR